MLKACIRAGQTERFPYDPDVPAHVHNSHGFLAAILDKAGCYSSEGHFGSEHPAHHGWNLSVNQHAHPQRVVQQSRRRLARCLHPAYHRSTC